MTRKEAIEVVKEAFIAWESEYRVPHEDWTETHKARDMAIEALSAERTGEWISNHDGCWNCSECGLRVLIYAKGNYCPNCGAKMMGGDTE